MFSLVIALSVEGKSKKDKSLDIRKNQSKDLLKENILRKRLEDITQKKVKLSKRQEIEKLCLQAGFKLVYVEYLMISIASSLVMGLLILIGMNNPILALLFLFIGFMTPKQVISAIRNRRMSLMEKQIGSFMHMSIKRYESTKDFAKAIELTMQEFKGEEPIYSEIKQTVVDIRTGRTVAEALDSMALRTGNKYMARFSDYYQITSSIGTEESRKKILYQAYIQFEENRKNMAFMKKQLSEPKREAYIMISSIPMFALYQSFTNETYLDFMLNTKTGQLGTAFISAVILGCMWLINTKIGGPID